MGETLTTDNTEHPVWNILDKDFYTEEGQKEIEEAYVFFNGLKSVIGEKTMQKLYNYLNTYSGAFPIFQRIAFSNDDKYGSIKWQQFTNIAVNDPYLIKVMKSSAVKISSASTGYTCSHDGDIMHVIFGKRVNRVIQNSPEDFVLLFSHALTYSNKSVNEYWNDARVDEVCKGYFEELCDGYGVKPLSDEELMERAQPKDTVSK